MIPMPSGVRVWIATGHTDMRRGMQGLALQVQEQLKRDPHGGDLYVFRGRRGDLAKILSMAPRFSSKVAPQNSPVWRAWRSAVGVIGSSVLWRTSATL